MAGPIHIEEGQIVVAYVRRHEGEVQAIQLVPEDFERKWIDLIADMHMRTGHVWKRGSRYRATSRIEAYAVGGTFIDPQTSVWCNLDDLVTGGHLTQLRSTTGPK